MKRPLCFIGFTMLAAISVLTAFDSQALLLCLLPFSIAAFTFSLLYEKTKRSLYLPFIAFAIILASVLLLISEISYSKTAAFAEKTCTVRTILKQTPQFSKENNRYYSEAKIITIDGSRSASNIKLSFSEKPDLCADNEILFEGYVYKTGASIKSVENYYKSDRIYIGCYNIKNIKVIDKNSKGYYYYTEKLKDYISSVFLQRLDSKTAGLMISFLTGDKSYLDKEIYNNFSRSGVSHLMAVSGMHLSVWIIFLGALFNKLRKKSIIPYITMSFAVVFIMILASFSGSVKRAGFMCLLYLSGKMISQKSDSLNNLGFSVMLILILNPYSVYDTGFLLSFLSTAAIIIFAIPASEIILKRVKLLSIHRLIKKLLNPVVKSVMISVFIFIMTLPVIALSFGYVSTVSVITNLLFLPFSFVMILIAGFLVLVNPVNSISMLVSFVASMLSRYAIFTTDLIAGFRYAAIPVSRNIIIPWLLIASAITFLLMCKRKTRVTIKTVTVAVFVLCVALSVASFNRNLGSYKMHIIPAGNKLAVMLTMNSKGVLIGYNDSYYFNENVQNIAKKNNIDIECMICTKSKKAEDFAEKNDIDSVITQSGIRVEIMNTVTVYSKENKVIIEGNRTKFEITDEAYLQFNGGYDIIYHSSFVEQQSDGEQTSFISIDNNDSDLYIQAFPKGKIRIGGGLIG